MSSTDAEPTIWLVDPISFSGMAYSDVGQIEALQRLGAAPLLAGSDGWMLDREVVPRVTIFKGTHDEPSQVRKGVAYALSLARLVRLVRARRPDVIHWQYSQLPMTEIVAMLAIRRLGSRQVYTAHELLPWTARRHHRWLFARLYNVMDAVVVHNADQREELVGGFGVDPSKVLVAPLGDYALFATPDVPQSDARRRLGLDVANPVALFFGAIRRSKGLDVLLHAWKEVAHQLPDAILVVVGKPVRGVDPDGLNALIETLGIGDQVRTVFAQVDPTDANSYYRAADVVVLPYLEIGTSGVLRYAYDSGRAVIATSVGEHVEQVIEGETGYLVPPADHVALSQRLVDALENRDQLHAMGSAARDYATANLGWIAPARTLLELYRSLGRRSGR
jgi:glycosyltransferase involved in cell wall biosynthesis